MDTEPTLERQLGASLWVWYCYGGNLEEPLRRLTMERKRWKRADAPKTTPCTFGQSRDVRESEFSRLSSRSGYSKNLSHRAREVRKQPPKKEDSCQAASQETQKRRCNLLHTCHLLGREVQGFKHLKPHLDAIYVVDMEGAEQDNFEFHQPLNGCVICPTRFPRSTSNRLSTTGTPGFAAQWHTYRQQES